VSRLLDAHQQTAGVLDQPPLLRGDAGRMEGRRIDHYEILRELGRGGMGSVYLAARTDQVYRKTVAFKVVRPESSSEDVIRRFQQEREIVAGLDHPNIARLLDGGATPEGLPYFVMEFVDGQPIDVYCDQRQLSVAERLKLFRTVCAAVEYAHGRGVVHRDLKPGNILVTAEGAVKLLDFGIAKLLGETAEAGDPLTRTGLRPMTPEYASPEQVKGESVGAASDQYSLGVVLYELLTGRRPYRMRSRLIHEVVRVICEEDPTLPSTAVTETAEATISGKPVSVTPQLISRSRETTPAELRRELSGDLDNILLRVLRKEPQRRYASVKDFSDDLHRRLKREPVAARRQSVVYRLGKLVQRNPGWIMAAVLLAAGIATGVVKIDTYGMLFLGWLAVSMIITATYSRSHFYPMMAVQIVVFFGSLGFAMMAGWYGRRSPPGESAFFHVLLFVSWAMGLAALSGLLRWPRRNRWAGKLLLDGAVPKRWYEILCAALLSTMLALAGGALFVANRSKPQDRWSWQAAGLVALAAALVYVYAMNSRFEIRECGILYFGLLFRWERIESFAWDSIPEIGPIMKLRFKGFSRFSYGPVGRLQIVVPVEKRISVDAIMNRQMSEWPSGTVTSKDSLATQ
jgi:serine/threonine protein kinase